MRGPNTRMIVSQLAALALVGACSPDPTPSSDDGGADGTVDGSLEAAPNLDASGDASLVGDGDASTGDASTGDASTGDASGGDASSGDASSDVSTADSSSDGAVDASGDADAGPPQDAGGPVSTCAIACGSGTKLCDGRCVSTADPSFGCGGSSCTSCAASFQNGSPTCQSGSCAVGSCRPGYADCDGNPTNGCEADLRSPATCLSCNTACSGGQVCSASGCASSCPFPYTTCNGGACRDVSTDPNACGSCNTPCPAENGATATCSGGSCGKSCNGGFSQCGGLCKHTQDDPSACGNACTVCPVPSNGAATCSGGVCDVSCNVGYASCGGACRNYFNDDANCGGCGITCSQGQTCLAGSCTNPTVARVVTALAAPQDIVVDGTNLYFTDTGSNTVTQVNKTTWATTSLGINQAKPFRLAVDGTHVYWSSNLGGAILRAPIGGGSSPVVLYSAQNPAAVAVDNTFVYWSDSSAHWRAPKSGGGQPAQLSTSYPATEYQANASNVYGWNSVPSALYSIDKATGTFTILQMELNPYYGMAITSQWIYYVRKFGGITTWIMGRPVGGGNLVAAASVPSTTGAPMIADDCGTFWGAGTEIWVRPEGTNVSLMVTHAATQVVRLALDSTYIYWTDAGGFIGRVRRP